MFLGKAVDQKKEYRVGVSDSKEVQHYDSIFENEMENQITKVGEAYEKMVYRDVIKFGLHEYGSIKDLYLLNCDSHRPRQDLMERYIYLQLLFLYAICPHFCEVAYIDYFLPFAKDYKQYPALLGQNSFPKPKMAINYGMIRSHQYFLKFMALARDIFTKVSKPRKGEAPKLTRAIIIYR
jgi:leucyl-tRNA synthetase